jgi:SAM-dependent methyltransferase
MDKQGWTDLPDNALLKKSYASYEEYLQHQASKLGTIDWLKRYHGQFREALRQRASDLVGMRPGATVVCLGARTGAECEAFTDLGALAIGVDLNPGEKNRHVVTGDFHQLQFADGVFDFAYTNALDHAMDLTKLLQEVRRVLKKGGVFHAEIVLGSSDEGGRDPGAYESLWWERVDSVIAAISNSGFWIARKRPFDFPWNGVSVEFVRQGE